jgi:hypothetical protein
VSDFLYTNSGAFHDEKIKNVGCENNNNLRIPKPIIGALAIY